MKYKSRKANPGQVTLGGSSLGALSAMHSTTRATPPLGALSPREALCTASDSLHFPVASGQPAPRKPEPLGNTEASSPSPPFCGYFPFPWGKVAQ